MIRSSASLFTAVVLACGVLPGVAAADYGSSISDGAYEPLVGGIPALSTSSGAAGVRVNLPFTFRLYDQPYNSVDIVAAGMLSFDANRSFSNMSIPNGSLPNAFIAPWWDNNDGVNARYATVGEAPDRRFIVEWSGFYASGDQTQWGSEEPNLNSMTVTLFETSNSVEMRYTRTIKADGNANMTATVGIENGGGDQGISALACAPNCKVGDYPAGKVIRFVAGRDAAVTAIKVKNPPQCLADPGVPCAYARHPVDITATLANQGGDAFTGAKVGFWLSTDARYSPDDGDDFYLGETGASGNVLRNGTSDLTGAAELPDLPPGRYYLIAVADSGNDVAESDERNNAFVLPTQITVRQPGPNLIIANVQTDFQMPAKLAHGKTTITVKIKNDGLEPANQPKVAVVLSGNQIASMQDVNVFNDKVNAIIDPGQTVDAQIVLDVPPGMPNDALPGLGTPTDQYSVGLIIDPLNEVVETNELDNVFLAGSKVEVGGGPLSIVSTSLPTGGLGSPYGAQLLVAGGDGALTWSVTGGPGGLSVDSTGFYRGIPGEKGTFNPTFTVADAKGATATKQIAMEISGAALPLTILTRQLPQASFSVPYEAELRALGGCAPYTWTLAVDGSLPSGLVLTPSGLIVGSPKQSGTFEVGFHLQDSCAAAGTSDVSTNLVVSAPPRVTIASLELTPALVGKPYTEFLTAAGGYGPGGLPAEKEDYTWTVVQTVRLPAGLGDKLDYLDPAAAPTGLAILANGTVTGNPKEAGSYLISLKVTDAAQTPDFATVLLKVLYEQGMAIVTLNLPDAIVNAPYATTISTINSSGDVTWELSPESRLPEGLELDKSAGTISGVPESNAVEAGDAQLWPILLTAIDEQHRVAQQALAIRVMASKPAVPKASKGASGGCAAGGGGAAAAGLLALSALLRRRR